MLLIFGGFSGLVVTRFGRRVRSAGLSPGFTLSSVLPALAMLGVFYSLAVHMHHSLGDWPSFYGTRGFPSLLTLHAELAGEYFGALLLIFIFGWPIVVTVTVSASMRRWRWRGARAYLGVFAVTCVVCFEATMFAPSPFLSWWWD